MPFASLFHETAAVLGLTAVAGALGVLLRQPLIVAFIASGILVGPSVLGWVSANDQFDLLSRLGITLLLFLVGLKLDLRLIRSMGAVALATGLGQVAFTSVVGFILALLLGLAPIPALYVAVALTFSSTIIIVKLLSDKREIDSLHGRIAVGFLIVQDIVVVLAMIVLTTLGAGMASERAWQTILLVPVKGALLIGATALFARYLLGRVLALAARRAELLVLFAIAWAIALAAGADLLGFSKEVGAFIAGVAIASTPYREAIGARLVSLRDFLLLFFFVDLGAQLELGLLGGQATAAIVLSLFVLVGNPLIVMIIMGAMGYRKRTGFLAGLTVAQISEFSLILGALGVTLGHIDREVLGLITLVGLVTISGSTYLILYSHPLYERLAPWLSRFERGSGDRETRDDAARDTGPIDVILFGLGRYGTGIAERLRNAGRSLLAVDFDPESVREGNQRGIVTHYGDAEDPEYPATLPLGQVRCIVSTARDPEVNTVLIRALRGHGFRGRLLVTAHNRLEAEQLRTAGADEVLLPFADAAQEAADRILRLEERDTVPVGTT